jgi:sugar phosphate isomerase/epimerase
MITRRLFSKVAAAAPFTGPFAARAAKIDSRVAGVQIGVQSYSFRDRSLDQAIEAIKQVGLGVVELWQGHVEPQKIPREDIRKWRLETPLSHFEGVRKKFDAAGIELFAYNYSFKDDFTDAEIERGFQMAKAMGVKIITASANVTTSARIDPFAARNRIKVGMHNHSRIVPNEFARPEDFAEAMKGRSEYIAINLDIGHFTAANFDPVEYLGKHHARIVTLHLKDRKRDQGANVPFGEGDTKIREVLHLLRDKRWKIPANIEYEYKGEDTVAEVRKCFEYCKKALA